MSISAVLSPNGINTVVNSNLAAASIFSFKPPTGPINPPEFIVPVIVIPLFMFKSFNAAIVSKVIADPADGPPIIIRTRFYCINKIITITINICF